MFKALIFDMDGVIIDSEPFHYIVNQDLFHQLGMDVSETDYRSYIGTSHTHMWTDLKGKHHLTLSVEALVDMQVKGNEAYLLNHEFLPVPGIVPLLDTLQQHLVRIGLASSSSMATIKLVLSKLGLRSYFHELVSGEAFSRSKPAPDIFLHTADRLGIEPGMCMVIEDAAHGVLAAKAAGMRCIGFQNPSTGQQDLSMADLIVQRITDLSWDVLTAL